MDKCYITTKSLIIAQIKLKIINTIIMNLLIWLGLRYFDDLFENGLLLYVLIFICTNLMAFIVSKSAVQKLQKLIYSQEMLLGIDFDEEMKKHGITTLDTIKESQSKDDLKGFWCITKFSEKNRKPPFMFETLVVALHIDYVKETETLSEYSTGNRFRGTHQKRTSKVVTFADGSYRVFHDSPQNIRAFQSWVNHSKEKRNKELAK